jgi:hypothetical protein
MTSKIKAPYDFYENGFGYIRLENLTLGNLPKKLKIDGDELVIKPEFHISLVWAGKLSEMIDKHSQEKIKNEIINKFNKFTDENSLQKYKLTNELRLVKRGSQKTIIIMANVPNLERFFKKLSHEYGVELPLQPTHVTLYTLPADKVGIGILSTEELQRISSIIEIPDIKL